VWILLVAGIRRATLEVEDRSTLLLVVGALFAVVLAVLWLVPAAKTDGELTSKDGARRGPGTDLTPQSEGGFPAPPVDLVVPPTPRSLRETSALTAAGSVTAAGPATSSTDREL
ncbi:MAG: hypothetical protein M3R09_05100, partial [Actinomycetota bacterium]|nr:hypothetical protein [Actinomycetota bacterium]